MLLLKQMLLLKKKLRLLPKVLLLQRRRKWFLATADWIRWRSQLSTLPLPKCLLLRARWRATLMLQKRCAFEEMKERLAMIKFTMPTPRPRARDPHASIIDMGQLRGDEQWKLIKKLKKDWMSPLSPYVVSLEFGL